MPPDYQNLYAAAQFIGEGLAKWGRINVSQYKEKWGTVRIYCSFGWTDLHSVIFPQVNWYPEGSRWMRYVTLEWLNWAVIPIQKRVYRHYYKQAIRRWPHLKDAILNSADWHEPLEGL